MYSDFVKLVQDLYQTKEFIPLHSPVFSGREKEYVCDAIETTFVSSVSDYVSRFERQLCVATGAKYAVSVMNGTAAIHLALHVMGVGHSDEVITQSLTFVATCNAIVYTGAEPVFVDVDAETLGMSPDSLQRFLEEYAEIREGVTINRKTNKRIAACLPMHTFGHPVRLNEIKAVCKKWNIPVVEDAAEAIGSDYQEQSCGTLTELGVMSFNGNKIITTGGGGAILTNDEEIAQRTKFLSTTAKSEHQWKFHHDELGFNYRMPGLNAALGCAQIERLNEKVADKRMIALTYAAYAKDRGLNFVEEPEGCQSNYWLNTLILENEEEREQFLAYTNENGVMTRPLWDPMHSHQRFSHCHRRDLSVSEFLYKRVVNIPSGSRL